MRTPLFCLSFCLFCQLSYGEVAITVYNQNLGLVNDSRTIDLPDKSGEIRFIDVAARIIPTSVHFNSEDAYLIEQNFEYDLVDGKKLLQKYIDHKIEITTTEQGFFMGTLLSAAGDIVIRETDGNLRSISHETIASVEYPSLPEGLITRPTLVWSVQTKNKGIGEIEVSYLTRGISWSAEYVALVGEKDDRMEITGWANITNNSGATYKDARIKLMAGDVRITQKKQRRYMAAMAEVAMAAPRQFEEQQFFEYHLYTLQRLSTIKDNQIKQISLFPAAEVSSLTKEYRFKGAYNNGKVEVSLIFNNDKKNNLAIPLPAGLVRIYKEGPDGSKEFIGEDKIDHTPKDEEIRLITGNAFDVVGERVVVDKQRKGKDTEEQIEIKIRNHKKEKIKVIVEETLWGSWEIIAAKPTDWTRRDARTIEWSIQIKPDSEYLLEYTVLNRR